MTVRVGQYDLRIALQRKSTTYSSSGSPILSWVTLATRWSIVAPASGDERNAAEQWIAREQTKFTIRWSQDLDDLSPLDVVIFPASDAANSPAPSRSFYDIISVHEQGRHETLAILAARRVG